MVGPLVEHPVRILYRRAGQRVREAPLLPLQIRVHTAPGPVPQHPHPLELLAHVRDDLLGRVGRGGGTQVGDMVQQRIVRLVPDGGDDRRTALGHGPHELLVGEGQQVLDAATAPRDDDDVHVLDRVQLLHRLHDLRNGVHALHGDVAHLEADGGPAVPGVLQHVPLRGRGTPADQPDQLRQEGQRLLPLRREQPFRRERLLQPLQPGQQLADADGPDLGGAQRQLAPGRVPLRLRQDDDAGALADDVRDGVEHLPVAGHAHGDVVRRVAQRQEHDAGAGPPRQLRDLPLDPHRAEPLDPAPDQPGDLADGEGGFGSGFRSHALEGNGGYRQEELRRTRPWETPPDAPLRWDV